VTNRLTDEERDEQDQNYIRNFVELQRYNGMLSATVMEQMTEIKALKAEVSDLKENIDDLAYQHMGEDL